MSTAFGVLGSIILIVLGLAFLIPGIIGTAVTSKIKRPAKALRVLALIALVIGICFIATPFVVTLFSALT